MVGSTNKTRIGSGGEFWAEVSKKGRSSDMRNFFKIVRRAEEKEIKIVVNRLNENKLRMEMYEYASFNNVGNGNSQIGS